MEELLKSFMGHIDKKFDQIDKRFEQIDKRFEQIDKRFEQIDKRFEHMDKRFDDMSEEMRDMKISITRLEDRQSSLELKMDNTASEFRSHFGKIETELKQHREAFKIYASELHYVTLDVNYLNAKIGVHDKN